MDLAVIPPLYGTGDVVNGYKVVGDSKVSERGACWFTRVLGRRTPEENPIG